MKTKIEENFNQKIIKTIIKDKYSIRFDNKNYNNLYLLLNQEIKYKVEFNFYGIFHPKMKMFFWGNTIPGINKNFLKKINKIKNMKHLFEDFSQENNELYFQILNENSIYLEKESQLDDLKKLILYLSEDLDIFMPLSSENKFQIIGISKILEAY